MNISKSKRVIAVGTGVVFSLALSACGGGSGTRATQPIPIAPATPVAPPPSPPPPSPPPPPTTTGTNFSTAEFRRSDGPEFHNAITAYQGGASGQGITVGVIDSGIDPNSREFAGRISPLSFDATGAGRALADEDGHGTNVARVIAGAKDDRDVHGIAFNATILALRADTAGSCTTPDAGETEANCGFSTLAIAAGVNRAIEAGARVINISLGSAGSGGGQLINAVDRATKAGIVIIVSAGNEGNDEEPKFDPLNPSPFSQSLLAAGNGLLIISTSVDDQGVISNFSNKAGTSKNSVLSALGSRICCEYRNDTIYRFDENGQTFVNVFNGTSFSAPQISGAAALLAQAFPNLTGAQIVNLLLTTARDAGVAGTDDIYGRGILDIGRAFAPQGATTLAGSTVAVPLTAGAGTTSSSMGDAGNTTQSVNAVILDAYKRAYDVNLGYGIQASTPQLRLTPALVGHNLGVNVTLGSAKLAMSVSRNETGGARIDELKLSQNEMRASRLLAGHATVALSKDTKFSLGLRQSAAGQIANLQKAGGDNFIAASSPGLDSGFVRRPQTAFAIRHAVAGLGVSGGAESGKAIIYQQPNPYSSRNLYDGYHYNGVSFAIDKPMGPLQVFAGASWVGELKTVLGALFADSFGQNGAQTLFADGKIKADLGNSWHVSANWRQGWTLANRSSTVAQNSLLKSNAFSFDVTKNGAFLSGDSIAFRVSQPLRVTSGGLSFILPVAYDYTTESATFGVRRFNLAPKGREIASELSWFVPFDGGTVSTNVYWRQEPGHFQNSPDDMGMAVRLNFGF